MTSPPPQSSRGASPLVPWGPAALVFLLFFAYSVVQAPVPGINEPHYLGKAKHVWNPQWAAGDFFLASSNPHLVFYLAAGWPTRFVSLEATAWIGRLAGYSLLSFGWTGLAGRLSQPWAAVPAAALFLMLASIGNFSGEWLVGGIEGKVFAYAFLFASIALWLDDRVRLAAACAGAAVSFHPVVGAWGFVCGVAAEVFSTTWVGNRTNWSLVGIVRRYAIPTAVFVLAALPGLVPALASLGGGSPGEVARANYLQVFIRLKHHLDPTEFSPIRYAAYGAMLAAFVVLWRMRGMRDRADRWFGGFVLASVIIALAGLVIGWHAGSAWNMPLRDLRTTLLKFYPFRLADVFVPLALAMAVARLLTPSTALDFRRSVGVGLLTVSAFVVSLAIVSPDRNPSRLSPDQLADWIDMAGWVDANTPPDALLVTPSRQWAFRWYSNRALYVNYKDAPQDTAGLLEWERRLDVTRRCWESSQTGRFDESDLRRLGEETGADYLVTLAAASRFKIEPDYDNGSYRIYGLR